MLRIVKLLCSEVSAEVRRTLYFTLRRAHTSLLHLAHSGKLQKYCKLFQYAIIYICAGGASMSGSKLKAPSMGFAVSIVNLVKHLKATHESIISNQIGRWGTSIWVNIREHSMPTVRLISLLDYKLHLKKQPKPAIGRISFAERNTSKKQNIRRLILLVHVFV